jgi:hypothetical protein
VSLPLLFATPSPSWSQGFFVGGICILVQGLSGFVLWVMFDYDFPMTRRRLHLITSVLFVSGLACVIGLVDYFVPESPFSYRIVAPIVLGPAIVGIVVAGIGLRVVKAQMRNVP